MSGQVSDSAVDRALRIARNYGDSNAKSVKFFNAPSYSETRRPLNVKRLLAAKVLRITYAGDGKGGFLDNEEPKSFSVVTKLNDTSQKRLTAKWPDKPASYALAEKMMNAPLKDGHLLYDGKYRQIVASARAAGLSDDEIFK